MDEPRIDVDGMKYGQMIGIGSFSKIYIALEHGKKEYAVRVTHMERMLDRDFSLLESEVRNMRRMSHPCILKMLSAVSHNSGELIVVTPLQRHLSCDVIMREKFSTGIPENAISLIFKDVLQGVEYMHARNMIHRTIKSSHILISDHGCAVLTGFRFVIETPGTDTRIHDFSALPHMTKYLNWLSPELLAQDGTGYGCKSDLYSVGITACELANGVVPYAETAPCAIFMRKLREAPPAAWDKNYPKPLVKQNYDPAVGAEEADYEGNLACASIKTVPSDDIYKERVFSKHLHSFISLCLTQDDVLRPSVRTMMEHKFIKSSEKALSYETIKALNLNHPVFFEAGEKVSQSTV